jgi:predicted dehydrogenase
MDELRFGVAGTGMMGCEHIRNLVALPGATVAAVADPDDRSRAEAAALAGPDVAVHGDHRDLLAAGGLDAVIVASPNHTHRSVLDDWWGSGVHLFVEKPLCTTIDDCREVQERSAGHDGLVWVGLEYRYMPAVARLLQRVRAGEAGRPRMVSIREHRYPFLAKVGNWNRFNRNTGGTLVEKCCHFFDLMNLALDERPVRVFASGAQDVNHLDERYDGEAPDILDNAYVVVDYPSGARALLDLCMFAEGSRWEQELTVVGDTGKLAACLPGFMELARGRRAELVVGNRGPDWPVDVQAVEDDPEIGYVGGHHGASYLELARFCDAIRTESPPEVTVEDGLWSVAMGVAAHRSIDEGRPVELGELGLAPT